MLVKVLASTRWWRAPAERAVQKNSPQHWSRSPGGAARADSHPSKRPSRPGRPEHRRQPSASTAIRATFLCPGRLRHLRAGLPANSRDPRELSLPPDGSPEPLQSGFRRILLGRIGIAQGVRRFARIGRPVRRRRQRQKGRRLRAFPFPAISARTLYARYSWHHPPESGQFARQNLVAAIEPRRHRAGGTPQNLSNLLVGETLDVAQQDRRPDLGGQA